MKIVSLMLALTLLSACASNPPENTANICSMFEDRRNWYKAAIKAEDRWDAPVYVSMAIIQQESSYDSNARPQHRKFLGFLPGRRPSSAYGYAQVLDETWAEYKRDAGSWGARRSSFAAAVDFVGWYNNNSKQRNNIARDDAYNLYLAYHEGNGGFARRTYADKPWLLDISRQVQRSADIYKGQYQLCSAELRRGWLSRLLF